MNTLSRFRIARCTLFLAACLIGTPVGAAPLTPQSLGAWRFVSDPQISPDGRRIVYVLSRADVAADKYESDLWIIEDDAPPRPLVTAPGEDTRPRWSPDGKRLAFASSRSGKRQIYILDMEGGEAWPLTREPEGVGAFSWSPDGSRIAYLARSPGTSGSKESPAPAPANVAATSGTAFVTDKLFYRNDGAPGFAPETRARLLVTDVQRTPQRGEPLTDGRNEPSEPAWSPDGRWLFFSSLPGTEKAEIENDTELYRVPADGSGPIEQLTSRSGPDDNPIVSATGLVAWTGYERGPQPRSSTTTQLYLMRAVGSNVRSLTPTFDRNVGETLMTDIAAPRSTGRQIAFAPDNRSVLFVSSDQGRARLYRANLSGGEPQSLSEALRGDLREFSVARNGTIAAIFGSPTQPYEVWTLDRGRGKWQQRTRHALQELPGFEPAQYEEMYVESFDGRRIQGWLIKPPQFDPARRHPAILYIHGGPHAQYGESFFHEFQMLASAGYVVIISNPRGSTGYGQEFANIIQYKYPGDDYRDLMAVVDHVVARGIVDEQRLGIAGGSGGGLLTSWSIAQTDRFAAALVERPVTNWLSFVPTSDRNAFFAQHWFRDYPWRDAQDYLARSPLTFVDKVETPVLVIQSEQDYRTPVDQGLQYYAALRMLGKEARLALFPGSSHGLSRDGPPRQRVERLQIISAWFDSKLKSRDGVLITTANDGVSGAPSLTQ